MLANGLAAVKPRIPTFENAGTDWKGALGFVNLGAMDARSQEDRSGGHNLAELRGQ